MFPHLSAKEKDMEKSRTSDIHIDTDETTFDISYERHKMHKPTCIFFNDFISNFHN